MEASVRSLFIIGLIILTIINQTSTKSGQCGRPLGTEFLLENDRIVAGYDVGYYRYPWYAALLRYGEVVCGAALVGPKTVVTAAHCYKEYLDIANKGGISLESLYTVKLGVYNICSTEKTEREFKIAKVHVHELYSSRHPYFDICVLTLENDTSHYQPICLPNKNVAQGGDILRPKEGTVPGLGTLKYHGALPCTVHEARILIYSDLECRQMINRTGNNVSAITNSFCAGYLQGGIDTCQGDSGGPLQVMNENGDYVLLGVVSFGFHCAMPGLLGMYTDVSKYVDWIYDKSGLNSETAITQKVPKSTTALVHVPTKSKPTHPPSYMRPIQVIIFHKNRLVVMKKNVLHYPIKRH